MSSATQAAATLSAAAIGPAAAGAVSLASAAHGATSAPAAAGAHLAQLLETARATIENGARQGIPHAHIVLSPESLGGLHIHLTNTADGLVARIVAEQSGAASTLQQGSDDLRRALQASGLTLARLDIESSDQRGAASPDPGGANFGGSESRQRGSAGSDVERIDGVTASQPCTNSPPARSLVNVLA